MNFDQTRRSWVIAFQLRGDGLSNWQKITTENQKKQMAVYLDETLLMDPIIDEPIPNGEGDNHSGRHAQE